MGDDRTGCARHRLSPSVEARLIFPPYQHQKSCYRLKVKNLGGAGAATPIILVGNDICAE
jgi:hypothetical protein